RRLRVAANREGMGRARRGAYTHPHATLATPTRRSPAPMKAQLDWLKKNHPQLISDLGKLVAIPSVSNDGEHQKEIGAAANLVCEQMRSAGLNNVEVLRTDDSNPYA